MEKWVEFTADFYDYYNRNDGFTFSSPNLSDLYRKIQPFINQSHVGRLEIKLKEHYSDIDFISNLALIFLAGKKVIMIQKTENNYTIIDLSDNLTNDIQIV